MSIVNIPLSASGLAAEYDVVTQVFTLLAKGSVNQYISEVRFERQTILGGLEFALVGNSPGLLPQGTPVEDKPFEAKFSARIPFSKPYFWPSSVVVITLLETYNIPIRFLGLTDPAPTGTSSVGEAVSPPVPWGPGIKVENTGDVVTPIDIYLPGGKTFEATTSIPDTKEYPLGSSVTAAFDSEWLKLVSSRVTNGQISWKFRWAKVPQYVQSVDLKTVTATNKANVIVVNTIVFPYNVYPVVEQ